MTKRINVAVLMGGKSAEHDISLISGREVAKNLNRKKYNVLPIVLPKNKINGLSLYSLSPAQPGREISTILNDRHPELVSESMVSSRPFGQTQDKRARTIIKELHDIDIVFIALHGPYGEDGTVQGFLELIGVPYTGSGVLASASGMDKIYSRKLFTQEGLTVPRFLILEKGQSTKSVWQKFRPPVFVKPSNQGSSVGASIAKSKNGLKKALKLAFSFSHSALVEEFLEGTEVTGAILGNNHPQALPLVEIVPKNDFFDYQAKYDENLTDEICPARISKTLTKKAQQAAVIAYQALGCRGFGRVDMIIKNNQAYVLEVNTIPGLTPVSLFPKAAKAAGISYPQLLDKIIVFALEEEK